MDTLADDEVGLTEAIGSGSEHVQEAHGEPLNSYVF